MILTLTFACALNFLRFFAFSRFVNTGLLTAYTVGSRAGLLVLLALTFSDFTTGNTRTATAGRWVCSELFEVRWTFSVDALTYVRLIVVLTVSTLVHLYSTEYRSEDPHLPRFLSYLSLFTFFRLILISADNFVSLFLGWEGVGLCSYLLISFWFTRIAANKAAIKARVVNRVADLTLTIGVLAVFYTFQTVEFNAVFGLAPFLRQSTLIFRNYTMQPLPLITALLFLGARGKSAQIGLHTWLPDAREGPTPVSALIHAATRVTAGVFLVIRSSYLFECTPNVLVFITLIGASTAFRAATAGLVQNDLKKVIAYSTCSQLGYRLLICGLSEYALGFFHLANHAFFKALLFLSAGAVIHSVSNEQDLRRFGGLLQILPYTYVRFRIGSLALRGFPFLTGFYSKDIILEVAGASYAISGAFAYWLGLITAFFTAFYSFRLIYLAFYGQSRSPKYYSSQAHELTARRAFSLAILSLGSIFLGYLARDLFIGFGSEFWAGSIYTSPNLVGAQIVGEFLPAYVKRRPFFGSCFAVSLVFLLNEIFAPNWNLAYHIKKFPAFYRFLSHKWYFDAVYNLFINKPLLEFAYKTIFRSIDKGSLEYLGPTSVGKILDELSSYVTDLQTGRVYDYALTRLVSLWAVLLLSLRRDTSGTADYLIFGLFNGTCRTGLKQGFQIVKEIFKSSLKFVFFWAGFSLLFCLIKHQNLNSFFNRDHLYLWAPAAAALFVYVTAISYRFTCGRDRGDVLIAYVMSFMAYCWMNLVVEYYTCYLIELAKVAAVELQSQLTAIEAANSAALDKQLLKEKIIEEEKKLASKAREELQENVRKQKLAAEEAEQIKENKKLKAAERKKQKEEWNRSYQQRILADEAAERKAVSKTGVVVLIVGTVIGIIFVLWVSH